MLAIVCWAAKPMIAASTAVEARIPVASRFSSVNWLSDDRHEDEEDDQDQQAAQEAQAGLGRARDL